MRMWIELDPAKRPWEYNCWGERVWKNSGWTRLWTDSDQMRYNEMRDYEEWKEKYGYEWEGVTTK